MQRDYTLNALDYKILRILYPKPLSRLELVSKLKKDTDFICLNTHLENLCEFGYISLCANNTDTISSTNNELFFITEKGIVAKFDNSYEEKSIYMTCFISAIISAVVSIIVSCIMN